MTAYRERLSAPVLWWLIMLGLVASVWIAYHHAYGPRVSLPLSGILLVLGTAALLAYGRVPVRVDDAVLVAGRARLPLSAIGTIEALAGSEARAARGPQLHPSAFTVLRGYVDGVVRVQVIDDADPVPYWLVSTRRPEQLRSVLEAARDQAGAGRG